jgi:hypothetical protein
MVMLAPFVIIGGILGKKVVQWITGADDSPAGFYAGAALGAAAIAIAAVTIQGHAERWRERAAVLAAGAWVLIASAAFANALLFLILPALGVRVSRPLQAFVVAGWIACVAAFAWLSQRRLVAAISVLVVVSVALTSYDLTHPAFSVRDVSRTLAGFADRDDYVVGALAHQLSFEGQFHPLFWWPFFGFNTEFAAHVRPRYWIRDEDLPSHLVDPTRKYFEPPASELVRIGVKGREPVLAFGLYPVAGVARKRFTLYRLSYEN